MSSPIPTDAAARSSWGSSSSGPASRSRGLCPTFGTVLAAQAVGVVGTLAGIRAALTVATLTLSPALLLYARAIRRGGVEFFLESSDDPRKSNSRY